MTSSVSLRRAAATKPFSSLRYLSSSTRATQPSHHNDHRQNHEYLDPNPFVASWDAPKDPAEAARSLQRLRRDYEKQVKSLRREFAAEVEVARLEKLRRDEARKEAQRVANEERKKVKAQARQARDLEFKTFQEELRLTLAKEKAEKFEYWKQKEQLVQEKKKEKSDLIHRKSSVWIESDELESKIREAINTSLISSPRSR